jgi:hypothetical protein
MVIFVCSCDKNEDLFEPFHHCMEKYWEEHPEIIYATETIKNPYYKTICKNYSLDKWTKRIRETLKEISDDEILLMIDDIFIRNKVDIKRIDIARTNLTGNIACFNFEKVFNSNDLRSCLDGWKIRQKGSEYELSLMCGLWDKQKLIDILSEDSDPWSVEYKQNTKGYDYYINSGDYIIDWGYKTFKPVGVVKGKWAREVVDFFKKEGIEIDYEKRGFVD